MFSYGVLVLFPPPIGSWESLVDVVAGSSPVGGTRSYCIPNRAGESQFPSVSPPEPTIGLSPRVRGNRSGSAPLSVMTQVYPRVCGGTQYNLSGDTKPPSPGSIPACAGEPASTDDATSTRNGLSPRVRGNREGPHLEPSPVCAGRVTTEAGSIPACAGEPHTTGNAVG